MVAATEAVKTVAEDTYIFKWSKEQTTAFIKLRCDNEHLFTGAKISATVGWRAILENMGLQGKVTPLQAKKKGKLKKEKYKVCTAECKYPGSGEGVSGKPTAATWPWFALMDEVLGQRPSTRPPVLIASIQEDTPQPSSAVGNQVLDEEEQEDECQVEQRREKIKKDGDDALLDLIRDDMRLQREMEERRAEEAIERMDRLFGLLEKLVEKKRLNFCK
ncbi:claudin [Sarotherodon galilaeus]